MGSYWPCLWWIRYDLWDNPRWDPSSQVSLFFFDRKSSARGHEKKAQQINWPLFYPHYWNRYYWDILGYNHWYMKFIEVYWFLVDKCRYAYSTLEWFPSAWWMFQCFFPKKTREKHAKHRPSLDQSLFPSYFLCGVFWPISGPCWVFSPTILD